MKTFKAGRFELELSDPSPQWVKLRIHHGRAEEYGEYGLMWGATAEELRDLRHIVDRALAEAERREPGSTA